MGPLAWLSMNLCVAFFIALSTVISRRLSVLWLALRNLFGVGGKQLLDPGARAPGDLPEDPHGFALSMENQRNPRLCHAQVPGDPSLGQIVFPHDALNFFSHRL